LGIGDWGLGIGAQSPIPNPQSPIELLNLLNKNKNYLFYKLLLLIGIIRNYLNFVVKLFKLFKNIKISINN